MGIFTLEDEQIVCTDKSFQTDKSSDVKTGRTNFQTTKSSENLFVCLFVFLKTICPSRRTSRPKSDQNSHSDGLRRTDGRFARLGGMELAKRAMFCGKFASKLAELAALNSH